MKFTAALSLFFVGASHAFAPPSFGIRRSSSHLSMVLEKPKAKKLPKIEVLKIESDHLVHPLKEVGSNAP